MFVVDVSKVTKGQLSLEILIDNNAFKEENSDAADVYDTTVKFPPVLFFGRS